MKRILFIISVFLYILIYSQNFLKIYFVDVGQGDGTLIITPNKKVIVMDCNEGYGDKMVQILQSEGFNNTISYMIASHYHADHIGGLNEIINNGYDVMNGCLDRGESYSSQAFTNYINAVNTTTGGRQTPQLGRIYDLGNSVSFQILTENGNVFDNGGSYDNADENGKSISIHLKYKNFDLYIGGDLTTPVENLLASKLGDMDIYQVDHHGSKTSSSDTFIRYIKPEVSIISCGNDNSYGHPTQTVIDRLVNYHSYIYQTELGNGGTIPNGDGEVAENTILLETDGCKYQISYGTAPIKYYVCDQTCDNTPPLFSGIREVIDTKNGGELELNWDDAIDNEGSYPISYNVYMSTIAGNETYHYATNTHPFTIDHLTIGVTYYFIVKAADSYGNEEDNNVEKFGIPSPDQNPPIFNGITAIKRTGNKGELYLEWNAAIDNSLPITYNIYRSTESGEENFFTPITTTENISYIDNVIDGITYYYVVRAKDSLGNEDNNTIEKGEMAIGDTLVPNFNGIKGIFNISNGILLTWERATDNSGETITYRIYRSKISNGENFNSYFAQTTENKYYDTQVFKGKHYYYVVRAVDIYGNEDKNNIEKTIIFEKGKNRLNIYPNPTKNGVIYYTTNEYLLKNIFTISGESIFHSESIIQLNDITFKYNCKNLSPGIYLFIFKSVNGKILIKKVGIIK